MKTKLTLGLIFGLLTFFSVTHKVYAYENAYENYRAQMPDICVTDCFAGQCVTRCHK